MPAPRVYIT
ncbi:hypothetical protein AYI68_g163, partial [Smittium mucronatum]